MHAGSRILQGHEAGEQAQVCPLAEGICQSQNFKLHTHRRTPDSDEQRAGAVKSHFNWWIFCPFAKQMSSEWWKI